MIWPWSRDHEARNGSRRRVAGEPVARGALSGGKQGGVDLQVYRLGEVQRDVSGRDGVLDVLVTIEVKQAQGQRFRINEQVPRMPASASAGPSARPAVPVLGRPVEQENQGGAVRDPGD